MVDFNNTNLGLYAIPALYALGFVPHLYACGMLTATQDTVKRVSDGKVKVGQLLYNMPNPRSADNAGKYAKILDQRTFHKWERARAAHSNILENAPYFISAILAALMTKVPAREVNIAAVGYLVSRVIYIFSYLRVEKGAMSYERTLWYFVGIGFCAKLWIAAGTKITDGDW